MLVVKLLEYRLDLVNIFFKETAELKKADRTQVGVNCCIDIFQYFDRRGLIDFFTECLQLRNIDYYMLRA